MKKNKIILVDGYGFVFRAYHALPPLTRDDGTPVGAVHGYINMIIRLLASLDFSHISVIFDSGSKTFRNDIYKDYKANRPSCPEDLIPQFPLIREATEALHLNVMEKVGYEADDLIATISKNMADKGFEVVIVSSDKDLMQLVGGNITMFDAMKNKSIGIEQVKEKFCVPPNKVLDVLSLIGDSSDNVPGVRNIGPKTAAELINKYGNLENLLNNIDDIKQNKRREYLENGVENAKLSKKLISLCDNVPIDIDVKDFETKNIDPIKLLKFLKEQGFRSLVSRVKKEFQIIEEEQNESNSNNKNLDSFDKTNKVNIQNINQIQEIKIQAIESGLLIIDFEYEGNNKNIINSITLSTKNKQHTIYHIAIKNMINDNRKQDLFSTQQTTSDETGILLGGDVIKELKSTLEDNSVIKIGYKIKNIFKYLINFNVSLSPIEDISVMAYIVNSASGKSNIRNLINYNLIEDIEDNGFGIIFDEIEKGSTSDIFRSNEEKINFYCFKNYAIFNLYFLLKDQIFKEKLNFVYHCFEKPLIPILSNMEKNGILIDRIKLKTLSEKFSTKIQELSQEIYSLSGNEEFNIASPKQLSEILFDKLKLEAGKKSKTGSYSTNSDILEDLYAKGHKIAGKILEFRHISKLKNTYCNALQKEININTSRVHTNFSNISTSTGRLSSYEPNLQNIPIRTTEGKEIRSAFIATKNHKLIFADYSQIELRVLAHMANITSLKEAFKNNKDIHNATACEIFMVKESEVDSNLRRRAKAINFGIIYGISAFGLARQLKIDKKEASNYMNTYFETYPGIKNYMDKYQNLGRKNGFVSTITGRKCFLNGINSKNPVVKGLAERLAINAPIQGSAADIIKKAMIDLSDILQEKKLNSKLILQIHDELILESPDEEVEEVSQILKTIMENAFLLDVPIKVDLEISNLWDK